MKRRATSSVLPGAVLSAGYYREQLEAASARLELQRSAGSPADYAEALGSVRATAEGAIAELERAEQQHERALAEREARETVEAGRCLLCGRPLSDDPPEAALARLGEPSGGLVELDHPGAVFHEACVVDAGVDAARRLAALDAAEGQGRR